MQNVLSNLHNVFSQFTEYTLKNVLSLESKTKSQYTTSNKSSKWGNVGILEWYKPIYTTLWI